jgi:hypothetical protein
MSSIVNSTNNSEQFKLLLYFRQRAYVIHLVSGIGVYIGARARPMDTKMSTCLGDLYTVNYGHRESCVLFSCMVSVDRFPPAAQRGGQGP